MSMESSEEIKRIFYQDSYGKKKIGSNVFRRTGKGSPMARVKGGVKLSGRKYKKYEKNSRVNSYNVYNEIIPYDNFKTLDSNLQEEILKEWLSKFTKVKIYTDMGINATKLNNLISKIKIDGKKGESMRLCSEHLEKYKNEIIPSNIFKTLQADQKFKIVEHYQKNLGMTNAVIAEKLGYNVNTFTVHKSAWRKEYELKRGESKVEDNFLIRGSDTDRQEESKVIMDGASQRINEKKNEDQETLRRTVGHTSRANTISIDIDGVYTGDSIKDRIKAISLLMNDKEEYQVSITIEVAKSK